MYMITISPISLFSFNFGLSVTGIGQIGNRTKPLNATDIVQLTIPWSNIQKNPSILSLLSWHTKLSDFSGCENELTKLKEWAESPQKVSVKFICGEGGVGKSRLAAHFGETLQREKWSAGYIKLTGDLAFPLHKKGTLLIIDYPEENLKGVAELLEDLAKFGKPISPLRVLFLTRQSIMEWESLILDNHSGDIVDMVPLEINRLQGPEAFKLYLSALGQASEILGTIPVALSQADLAKWLEQEPENSRALFVLAAALHMAIYPEDNLIPYSGSKVVNALAKREYYRLRGIAEKRHAQDPDIFAKILAMAAFTDGLSLDQIEIMGKDILDNEFSKKADLRKQLRLTGIFSNDTIQPPKPDIVAASFVLRVFSENPELAPELIWAVISSDLVTGLNHLARLNHDAEVVLGINKYKIRKWLAEAVQNEPERSILLNQYFYEPPIPLGFLDAAILTTRILLKAAMEEGEQAMLLSNLSVYLSDMGDKKGALSAIQEAVGIRRRLAEANPARYESDMAMSINNLSNRLSDMGDKKGALSAIQEAIEIRRRLAKANPARYEPDLAGSLNNLSVCLSDMGDKKGALSAIQEAVETRRRLAEANPARYEPDLAGGLNNLSNSLRDMGDKKGALSAIQEAIEIRRRLAKANPARYEPDLAMSINNLSNRLSDIGDKEGARAAAHEAAEILRRLEHQ